MLKAKPMRRLKKYRNRRLYDFGSCRYVDYKDVRVLIKHGVPFRIVGHPRECDITVPVLFDVLAETLKQARPNDRLERCARKLIAAR